VIDYSRPASDGVFDGADFEKFLHDRIKVEGKAGQLGDNVKIIRDGMIYYLSRLIIRRSDLLRQATANSPLPRTFLSQNATSST